MYLSGPALWNVHVREAIKSGPAVRTLARWQSNAQWQQVHLNDRRLRDSEHSTQVFGDCQIADP